MKHLGSFERQKCLLLGYSREKGDKILLVPITRLTTADQRWVSEIINTGVCQRSNNIIPELQRHIHNSGMDGFTFLVRFANEVPAYQVSLADEAQAREWFGRGGSNFDSTLKDQPLFEDTGDATDTIPEAPVPSTIAYADRDVKLDIVLQELASLTARIAVLEAKTSTVAVKKATRGAKKPRKKEAA